MSAPARMSPSPDGTSIEAPQYEVVPNWLNLPTGWELGQVAVATDSKDRVYLYNRSDRPMIICEPNGEVVDLWNLDGYGPNDAHGIFIDKFDGVYLPNLRRHSVTKYGADGAVELVLGKPHQPSDPDWSGDIPAANARIVRAAHGPFTAPTDVAVAPNGDIFCSDGYGNTRVHRFDAAGLHVSSWGSPGKSAPGAFHVPHGVWVTSDGRIMVADRENDRVQTFDSCGNVLAVWDGFSRPTDIFVDQRTSLVYISELGRPWHEDALVSICDMSGNRLARWGTGKPGGGHSLWVDSCGDLYINQNRPGERLLKFARTS